MDNEKARIDFSTLDLSGFVFRGDPGTPKSSDQAAYRFIARAMGVEALLSPILARKPDAMGQKPAIETVLGMDDPDSRGLLAFHEDRLKTFTQTYAVLYLAGILLLYFPALIAAILNAQYLLSHFALFSLVMLLCAVYAFSIMVGVGRLVVVSLAMRSFPDSICVMELLFLLLDLAHCQNPLSPAQKRQLLLRTRMLARATRSLASFYSLDGENQSWARRHFQLLAGYIQERETWIVAPKDNSLDELQQDFYRLARIYIRGTFGEFKFKKSELKEDPPKKSLATGALEAARVGVGIVLPILALVLIRLKPVLMAQLFDTRVLALLCAAWLLVALDLTLKLGIVSSLVEIAKGIKELS